MAVVRPETAGTVSIARTSRGVPSDLACTLRLLQAFGLLRMVWWTIGISSTYLASLPSAIHRNVVLKDPEFASLPDNDIFAAELPGQPHRYPDNGIDPSLESL